MLGFSMWHPAVFSLRIERSLKMSILTFYTERMRRTFSKWQIANLQIANSMRCAPSDRRVHSTVTKFRHHMPRYHSARSLLAPRVFVDYTRRGRSLSDGEGRGGAALAASLPAWLRILFAQRRQQMRTLELLSHAGEKMPPGKKTNTDSPGAFSSLLL